MKPGYRVAITGASRGIGRATAIRLGQAGAKVGLIARTLKPHRILAGTLEETAAEVNAAGGDAKVLQADVTAERDFQRALESLAQEWGGLDALIHNAGALKLSGTESTSVRHFDRLLSTNLRAAYVGTQAALPFLRESTHPHIVCMAPPIERMQEWLVPYPPYALSKFAMSLAVLGWAGEFRADGIGVNGVWPESIIETAALKQVPQLDTAGARLPEFTAEALFVLLSADPRKQSGELLLDREVLERAGRYDPERWRVDPSHPLERDLFVGPVDSGDT